MKILTIAMACDEQDLITYFVRYYRQLGDVIIFDDESSDDTAALARAAGARVLPVAQDEPEPEFRLQRMKNHAWKPMRDQYDWIIVVDVDEFVYHENLEYVFHDARAMDASILITQGYNMISDGPPQGPEPIIKQIRQGALWASMSKPCCFDARRVAEINYVVGGHNCGPQCAGWLSPYPGLKLLHYHYLGIDWVMKRYADRRRQRRGVPPIQGWRDYRDTLDQLREFLADIASRAVEVV